MNLLPNYTILYCKRKTAALYVNKDASLEVRAPIGFSKKTIEKFVQEKIDWIEKHQQKQKQRNANKSAFELQYDDSILFYGKKRIIVPDEKMICFSDEKVYIPANLNSVGIQKGIINCYRQVAVEIIRKKVSYFANQMDVSPSGIKISNAKSRWGSCNGHGVLRFSWRLMMASEETINYVVVHELAHLIEFNHSKRFWDVVKRYIPNYVTCKKELRIIQLKLENENW